jgi:GxGYxYP putative glycoside hydrolase C-terminal domain
VVHSSLPNDPRDPNSYSLIPVHVWSRNVSDVVATASYLGSDYFDVVTPDEFVAKLSASVFHDCANAPSPSGPYSQSCSGGSVVCGSLTGVRCRDDSGDTVTNPFFDYTACSGV